MIRGIAVAIGGLVTVATAPLAQAQPMAGARDRLPISSWAVVSRLTFGEEINVLSCKVDRYGPASLSNEGICEDVAGHSPESTRGLRGTGAAPVTVTAVEVHQVEGLPPPPNFIDPQAGRLMVVATAYYEIDAAGRVRNCRAEAPEWIPDPCDDPLLYRPVPIPAAGPHKVRRSYSVYRTSGSARPQ